MAQDFAPLLRSIWSDEDWRALSVDGQHVYLMLLSHPDRNAAGVLSLTVKKWTRLAVDMTGPRLSVALTELDTAGFIVVDDETEEVLVRSFIRRATVYKHIRMLANALREASEVESPRLRSALAQELGRLPRLSIPENEKMKAEALAAQQRVDAMADRSETPPDGPGHGMAHPMAHGMAHPPVVVAVDVVGAGAVTATDHNPADSFKGGSYVSNASNPPAFPDHCASHAAVAVPGKCGDCADQRKANASRPRQLMLVPSSTQKCLVHAEPDVNHCRGCAADQKAAI